MAHLLKHRMYNIITVAYELLGGVRLGFLVVSPYDLHVDSSNCKELRRKPVPGNAWSPKTFIFFVVDWFTAVFELGVWMCIPEQY
jgi:hypothetical protein